VEIPILGQDAARARAGQQQASDKPELAEAECAFIIYQTTEGEWKATNDLNVPVTSARAATANDIASGCGRVKEDLLCRSVIEQTTLNILGNLQRMMIDPQLQMQAMQANEAARAAAAAANGKLQQ